MRIEPPAPCAVQVVGPSGSGKTTVIVEAARRLAAGGVRVAVLKHTHHDIDVAGKDSWRFLEEGEALASVIVKGSGERLALFTRLPPEAVLQLLKGLVDAVLIEGFKDIAVAPRVEPGPEAVDKIVSLVVSCLEGKGRSINSQDSIIP